jgi:hypothetical protein
VKVNNEGNAIPKSRADLAPKHLADGWANDGHMDLATREMPYTGCRGRNGELCALQ